MLSDLQSLLKLRAACNIFWHFSGTDSRRAMGLSTVRPSELPFSRVWSVSRFHNFLFLVNLQFDQPNSEFDWNVFWGWKKGNFMWIPTLRGELVGVNCAVCDVVWALIASFVPGIPRWVFVTCKIPAAECHELLMSRYRLIVRLSYTEFPRLSKGQAWLSGALPMINVLEWRHARICSTRHWVWIRSEVGRLTEPRRLSCKAMIWSPAQWGAVGVCIKGTRVEKFHWSPKLHWSLAFSRKK